MLRLLVVLACCTALGLQAQERSHQFRADLATEGTYNRFLLTDLDYNPQEGSFILYGQLYRGVNILNVKGGKKLSMVSGATQTWLPAVTTATVKGGKTEIVSENINLQSFDPAFEGKPYEARLEGTQKIIGTDKTDKPINDLKTTYPRCFPTKVKTDAFHNMSVDPSMSGLMVRVTSVPYISNGIQNELKADKATPKIFKVALPETDGKYIADAQTLKDNKRKLLTASVGLAKKGEGRFSNFINKKIVTVNGEEQIINSFDVTFGFPRALMFAQPLGRSASDTVSTFEQGGLFIYGRVFGGGKSNDPDPTNYDYILVDGNGALTSKGAFKFGSEKRDLSPQYAYKANDKVYLLAKGVGKDNPSYAVLVFDNTGLIETREYPFDKFKAMAVGPYDKGLTTNYGRNLVATNHINLPDGSALICGEAYEDETPVGTPMGSPKVINYMSQVFLLLDPQGNLKNTYIIEKVDAESKKAYNFQDLISVNGSKITLVGSEKAAKVSPVMTVIDVAANKATRKSLKDDEIYSVDGGIVYRYFPDAKEIVFVGETPDSKTYSLNATVYKLN